MLIPIDREGVGAFIMRAKELLARPKTHVYVDTSLAMWLTAVGPTSRESFFLWAETLGDRIHVPAWTLQEYFKHHKRKTQVLGITEKCSEAEQALNALRSHMRIYADGTLIPNEPEMAFVKQLADASDNVTRAIRVAKEWDFESAAISVIKWLNEHALDSTKAFSAFAELGRRGRLRYSHEVPPGFEDRRKKRNRYGDLLFWEDVVEDVRKRKAETGVILTRDRKPDWFFSTVAPEPDDEWKSLKGRWDPVPVPHPLLSAEMKAAAKAELLLIDELYLGGVMWSTDKAKYGRLAAVSFGMTIKRLEAELAPPPSARERAARRAEAGTISMSVALAIVREAKEGEVSEQVSDILAGLDGEAPDIEAAIENITPAWISKFAVTDLAVLARKLYDAGFVVPSAAHATAARLLDHVDRIDRERASAIVVGMLVAAYFDGTTPRDRPAGALLQDVYEWRIDPGVARALTVLRIELVRQRSPAIFLPAPTGSPISLQFAASQSVNATPAALGQIFVGPQAVLRDVAIDEAAALSAHLDGCSESDIATLTRAVVDYYGIPRDLVETDVAETETWTILAGSGFERFGPLDQPKRSDDAVAEEKPVESNVPPTFAGEAAEAAEGTLPAGLPGGIGLDAAVIDPGDSDDGAGTIDEDEYDDEDEDDLT